MKDREPCRQCPRCVVFARGLCRSCYMRAYKLVKDGATTWEDLLVAGLAAPSTRSPWHQTTTLAFEKGNKPVSGLLDFNIFSDGGLAGSNPSIHGGSWAWCFIHNGKILRSCAGGFSPQDMGMDTVECNLCELVAAVRALESAPDEWVGTLHTDSKNTLWRLTKVKPKFGGVPEIMVKRTMEVRRRFPKLKVILLAGHPTGTELRLGYSAKRGYPVSQWNVHCDQLCTREALKILRQKGLAN